MIAFKTNVGSGTKANKFGRVWGVPENQSDIKGIFEIYLENSSTPHNMLQLFFFSKPIGANMNVLQTPNKQDIVNNDVNLQISLRNSTKC